MSQPMRSVASSASADALVADVVAEVTDRLQAGEKVDVEEYAARYPDLAERLRQLLPALEALGGLAAPAGEADGPGVGTSGVLGDYRILRELGRGGMAVVYEAEQISLRRRVALKVLPFAATMDPRQLQRFKNESLAAASLEHPHIVPVYAVGCDRGVHYYAMKFIEGQSLEALLRQLRAAGLTTADSRGQGPGPLEVAARPSADTAEEAKGQAATQPSVREPAYFRRVALWGTEAAEALEYAHSLGVVHRDVKPANLMIDGQGQLWVADFGLARTAADAGLTMTGDLLGTLRYMSPEQALAKHNLVDHRTDVYALGATLYELLALRPAIDGKDRQEVLRQIAFEEPRSPAALNREIPRELETIVLKAMAKESPARYATAKELADDLRRFLEDKPIRARRPSLRQQAVKWARRHSSLVATSAVFLVLALLGLTTGIILIAHERGATLQRERDLRQQLYAPNIRSAHEAWLAGDLVRMREVLDQDKNLPGEDLRGFEWHHLQALLECAPREVAAREQAHKRDVYCVTWSPDGRMLVSCGLDGFVRLWDAQTLQLRDAWRAHDTEVNIALFTPDGKGLATASDDGSVRLWKMREGTLLAKLQGHGDWVESLAFSPNGKTLAASGRDGVVRLWDVETEKRREVSIVHSAAWAWASPRFTLADWSLALWVAQSPITTPRKTLDLKAGKLQMLTFSPDGRTLAAAAPTGTAPPSHLTVSGLSVAVGCTLSPAPATASAATRSTPTTSLALTCSLPATRPTASPSTTPATPTPGRTPCRTSRC